MLTLFKKLFKNSQHHFQCTIVEGKCQTVKRQLKVDCMWLLIMQAVEEIEQLTSRLQQQFTEPLFMCVTLFLAFHKKALLFLYVTRLSVKVSPLLKIWHYIEVKMTLHLMFTYRWITNISLVKVVTPKAGFTSVIVKLNRMLCVT